MLYFLLFLIRRRLSFFKDISCFVSIYIKITKKMFCSMHTLTPQYQHCKEFAYLLDILRLKLSQFSIANRTRDQSIELFDCKSHFWDVSCWRLQLFNVMFEVCVHNNRSFAYWHPLGNAYRIYKHLSHEYCVHKWGWGYCFCLATHSGFAHSASGHTDS